MPPSDPTVRATGGCLCGAVRFSVRGKLRDVILCHCKLCRRQTTHIGAFTACAVDELEIASTRKLRWYRSSPTARRGFCAACGATLFWEPTPVTHISIAAGSLDEPTGLHIGGHICTAHKGDYYEITDGLPQA